MPAAKTPQVRKSFTSGFFGSGNRCLPSSVMLQKRNRMVKPLQMADITLTAWAMFSGDENIENIRPINWNEGAPGG